MASARAGRISGCCWLALVVWSTSHCLAESDSLQATVGKPAIITAAPPQSTGDAKATLSRQARLIISVTNYHPTDDGSPVEVLVKGRIGDGVEREVGRFGITPDQEYSAAEPSGALRFSLPLPRELTADEPVIFSVQLVPVSRDKSDKAARETGNERDKGASLRLGKAEIR
jgi:hypothetical protein